MLDNRRAGHDASYAGRNEGACAHEAGVIAPGGDGMRLVVLASGNGSNLQALIDAEHAPDGLPGANIAAVFSDKPDAFALERARQAGIPAIAFPCAKGNPRAGYDAALAHTVSGYSPDFILLLGWMRILSNAFLSCFPGKVVNLHPALPGSFPGTHSIERAFEAYRASAIRKTGVMTHYVPDEGIDSGPVIATAEVAILPDDTLESLEARVHEAEHRLVVETVQSLYIHRRRD
jgi:phosphoribosylglycinamide formyltransferase 1